MEYEPDSLRGRIEWFDAMKKRLRKHHFAYRRHYGSDESRNLWIVHSDAVAGTIQAIVTGKETSQIWSVPTTARAAGSQRTEPAPVFGSDLPQRENFTPAPPPPSVRQVTGWLTRHPITLTEVEKIHREALLDRIPEMASVTELTSAFAEMLTTLDGLRLPEWITDAMTVALPDISTFAADSKVTSTQSPPDSPPTGTQALSKEPKGSKEPKEESTGSRHSNGR
ncbi:hypothetical protein [Streptomyces sp. NPDC005989]|uniref:hypothetical protein n=1 Tax=Streptomyces sp. NPDC005989 TaxID=3156727 RepID=UPI0033D1D1E5